jgi:hypothetical protein
MLSKFKTKYQEIFGNKVGRPTGKTIVILTQEMKKEIPEDVSSRIKLTATLANQPSEVKFFLETLLQGIKSEVSTLENLKTKISELLKIEGISVRFDATGICRALELNDKSIATVFSILPNSSTKIDDLDDAKQLKLLEVFNGK